MVDIVIQRKMQQTRRELYIKEEFCYFCKEDLSDKLSDEKVQCSENNSLKYVCHVCIGATTFNWSKQEEENNDDENDRYLCKECDDKRMHVDT